eukprot:2174836-Rhodomonas_salina.1
MPQGFKTNTACHQVLSQGGSWDSECWQYAYPYLGTDIRVGILAALLYWERLCHGCSQSQHALQHRSLVAYLRPRKCARCVTTGHHKRVCGGAKIKGKARRKPYKEAPESCNFGVLPGTRVCGMQDRITRLGVPIETTRVPRYPGIRVLIVLPVPLGVPSLRTKWRPFQPSTAA